MNIAERLDHVGKPAWIGLMVLGFIVFWPVGLAILAYILWSGRMSCGRNGGPGSTGPGRWHDERRESPRDRMHRWWHSERGWHRERDRDRDWGSSGNRAFDEYRMETLRRLEDEQREFRDYLDRLRHAKDKAEFDQFVADRGRRPDTPPPGSEPPPPPAEPPRA